MLHSNSRPVSRSSPRRRANKRHIPAFLSVCVMIGSAAFLRSLATDLGLFWGIVTGCFSAILAAFGEMLIWAVISGIQTFREQGAGPY